MKSTIDCLPTRMVRKHNIVIALAVTHLLPESSLYLKAQPERDRPLP